MNVGDMEGFLSALRDGGWEFFEAQDDKLASATRPPPRTSGLTEADRRTIAAAWAEFAATPAGDMALQAIIDRTLLRDFFPVQAGMPAEQAAIHAAYRQGQNFIVQLILNQIRLAREEPTTQRDI